MMRTKYRTICVKFREDAPEQITALRYLQDKAGARYTYADVIADLVKGSSENISDNNGRAASSDLIHLSKIEELCHKIFDRIDKYDIHSPEKGDAPRETNPSKETPPEDDFSSDIAAFVFGMGDDE